MGFCPTAWPTACADILADPFCLARISAISPYVMVFPYGIVRTMAQTARLKAVVFRQSGGVKSGVFPLK